MTKVIKYIFLVLGTIVLFIFLINLYIILSTKKMIIKEMPKNIDIDCILVLGAGIYNHQPSPMLKDRLSTGLDLYRNKVAHKILVSGDHREANYDEVNVMKNYLIEKGIPSQDIFMDHAGISSYDSIYRAKKIFRVKKIVIVTQEYHLYRALYIAKHLGLDAYGVPAKHITYVNQEKREVREIMARVKDFFKCIFKPEATFLGEVYPILGNGDRTNDK